MALGEWMEQLAAAAMLGSERAGDRALEASEAGGLGAVIERLGQMPREKSLLSAAGLAGVYARAGVLPVKIAEAGAVAPAASKPVVSVTSAQHLSLLLAGHYPEVLPEYLDLVASSGRTLPPRHLPVMLGMAARDEALRQRVMAVLDARAMGGGTEPRVDRYGRPAGDCTFSHGHRPAAAGAAGGIAEERSRTGARADRRQLGGGIAGRPGGVCRHSGDGAVDGR